MPTNIRAIWRRIETIAQRYIPDAATMLNPPAWDWDIEEVEDALGLKLPEDLKESLQVHNGVNDPRRMLDIFDGAVLFGSGEIVKSSRMLSNLYEWNRNWIPFATRRGGWLCICLDPSSARNTGEIATFPPDVPHYSAIAPSFGDWLENHATFLEREEFIVAGGGLIWLEPLRNQRLLPPDRRWNP